MKWKAEKINENINENINNIFIIHKDFVIDLDQFPNCKLEEQKHYVLLYMLIITF
jgi:hypothetical protein